MSVLQDMVQSYRNPRAVFRRRVGDGPREDRALAVLMFACALVFAAQMPRLARQAHETGEELNMLLGATLLGWLFIMPWCFMCLVRLAIWPRGCSVARAAPIPRALHCSGHFFVRHPFGCSGALWPALSVRVSNCRWWGFWPLWCLSCSGLSICVRPNVAR